MNARPPSAAASIYPHLKSGTPDVVERRQQGSIADALFPHLKPPAPKPSNPDRDSLLRNLRELRQRMEQRLARERAGQS